MSESRFDPITGVDWMKETLAAALEGRNRMQDEILRLRQEADQLRSERDRLQFLLADASTLDDEIHRLREENRELSERVTINSALVGNVGLNTKLKRELDRNAELLALIKAVSQSLEYGFPGSARDTLREFLGIPDK